MAIINDHFTECDICAATRTAEAQNSGDIIRQYDTDICGECYFGNRLDRATDEEILDFIKSKRKNK